MPGLRPVQPVGCRKATGRWSRRSRPQCNRLRARVKRNGRADPDASPRSFEPRKCARFLFYRIFLPRIDTRPAPNTLPGGQPVLRRGLCVRRRGGSQKLHHHQGHDPRRGSIFCRCSSFNQDKRLLELVPPLSRLRRNPPFELSASPWVAKVARSCAEPRQFARSGRVFPRLNGQLVASARIRFDDRRFGLLRRCRNAR